MADLDTSEAAVAAAAEERTATDAGAADVSAAPVSPPASTPDAAPQPAPAPAPAPAADELEPKLKYERLGSDVKTILHDGSAATCLCLSEKVLALGTSAGKVHILDYSGNEVKRFSLHAGQPVKHISFDDKAEYFATCCGDNYVSVSSLYTDETTKFTFKRPITVVALEGRYASRKTREFVTGDVRGRLKLSSQGWLGRSDHVIHQGEGTIRALCWHTSTLAWANDVGIKVYDTNMHQFVGSIKRPRGGRFADCFDCQLYLHEGGGGDRHHSGSSSSGSGSSSAAEVLYVAWPDCIKVADVLTHIDPTSGAVSKALRVSASIPTDYFCLGVVPHGQDLAVLVFVTDEDPDQDQVGLSAAAAAADGQQQGAAAGSSSKDPQQQQGQLAMQALPQQQEQPDAAAGTAAAAAAAAAEQADVSTPDVVSGPSTAGPINIPQPIRRPQRAANAYVRSPSGPHLLQQSTPAAGAGAGAGGGDAAAAAGGVGGGGSGSAGPSPQSTPRSEALLAGALAGGGSASSSPDVDTKQQGRILSAAAAGVVQRSSSSRGPAAGAAGRPPLPSYSRSSSVVSRASAASTENTGMPAPYIPQGNPLRPELRIISLSQHKSESSHAAHTHDQGKAAAGAAAAGTSQAGQQQQLCSACIEVASDALSVKGYEHYLPADYHFVPSYGNEFALLSGGGSSSSKPRSGSSSSKAGTKAAVASPSRSSSSKPSKSGAQGKAAAAAATAGVGGGGMVDSSSSSKKQQGTGGAAAAGSKAGSDAAGKQQQQSPSQAAAEDGAAAAAADAAAADAGADAEATLDAGEQQEEEGVVEGQAAAAAAEGDAADAADIAVAAPLSPAASAALEDNDSDAAAADDVLEDFREFMYFIVSPQDIVIGRHRDMEDRISWCLAVGRYEAALSLAEADRTTSQELWDTVVQAYLESLTSAGHWSDAAAILPRLLKDSAAAWERWLFTFAQARQLPLLAPVLPVKDPLLPSHAYDLVLQALLTDPSHHGELLTLVSSWPHSIFHPTKLIDTIAQRLQRPGGESRELWQVLALLYKGQGRPDLSLAIYLQLQLPSVFDFIQEHGLLLYLDRNAYLLMAIDDKRALELLGAHLDTLPPGAVVPGLLDAMSACESRGDEADREVWRHRLFAYLDKAFAVEPSSVSEYAELCVHLYADYCPARLMDFLQGSQTYPLEAALEVAQQRGLIDEQVYVLSRMGNSRAALRLIIRNQQDIPRAIEFVRLQQDEELWSELIDWALSSADTTGQLLDHIGGNINPLRVIQKIPEGLAIDNLRDRLRAIISDFRTQTSLREGCNAILRSDCLHLVQRLQREVKRAMPTVWLQRLATHGSSAAAAAAAAAADGADAAAGAMSADSGGASATGSAAAAAAAPSKASSRGAAGGMAAAAAAAAGTSSSSQGADGGYLPQGLSTKAPHWLKFQCGSGRAMQAASSQDVPAMAVHALAAVSAAGGGTGLAPAAAAAAGGAGVRYGSMRAAAASTGTTTPSGSSSSFAAAPSSGFNMPPLSPAQPSRVWIGRTGSAAAQHADGAGGFLSSALGPEGLAATAEHEDEGAAAGGGSSAAASRRSSSRQQSRQRGAAAASLPSLVTA